MFFGLTFIGDKSEVVATSMVPFHLIETPFLVGYRIYAVILYDLMDFVEINWIQADAMLLCCTIQRQVHELKRQWKR